MDFSVAMIGILTLIIVVRNYLKNRFKMRPTIKDDIAPVCPIVLQYLRGKFAKH